jgi:predicted enzyme related to lactoylglutathione lyase
VIKLNLNLNSLLVSTENPKVLREFYTKLFDKNPDMDMEGYFGWVVGKCFISFGPHDNVKSKSKEPERIMFNFETEDVKAEFERISGLGAEVVAKPYTMGQDSWIATFADPDGNYFQLMSPWKDN